MKKTYLILDYETFSEAPLKKVGAFEYSVHPSTEIMCVAFRLGTRETLSKAKTRLWIPSQGNAGLSEFLRALRDPAIDLVAHNSFFEQVITANVLSRVATGVKKIPIERWHCTGALARSRGLPGSLEEAGKALGLEHQKDGEGHRLMLKLSKPRRPSKNNPSTRHDDPEELNRLALYCKRDVDSETELFLKLPELHPRERQFWILNQVMNHRGFGVDRQLVQNAQKLIALETKRLDQRIKVITNGRLYSVRQRDGTLDFIRRRGVKLENLQAKTIADKLKEEIPDATAREILEIRNAISRSSTSKYIAFDLRSKYDSRLRDNTVFFGAHTGRESGSGVQPQNLFKRVLSQEDVSVGIELIKKGDSHALECLFDKPMDLYASSLRGCIVPGRGCALDVGDFATIEVRVLFWLADETTGLEEIRNGVDLYCAMAGTIYGIDPKRIKVLYSQNEDEATKQRQLGKETVLGSGFGIGVGGTKFQKSAANKGINISLELAKAAVRAYREKYWRVPVFWRNVESACIKATKHPGKKFRLGKLLIQRQGEFLEITLPIGRKFSYFKPRVVSKLGPWGETEVLSYVGVLSPSKVVGRIETWGGKLTENFVQAIARDLLLEACLGLEQAGISKPVLAVHDEIVCERNMLTQPENPESELARFINTMERVPDWAGDLPIKVEAWSAKRYRK